MFESLRNFRDVGGCATIDGRIVRPGVIYRSATLASLTDRDAVTLGEMGIRTIIDLRRPDEVSTLGRVADATGRRYINIAPTHALWDNADYDEAAGPARYLADRYLDLANDGIVEIGSALRLISTDDAPPTLVHCFAGKDRTGVLIALTLALVGVSDQGIADDYARSDDWSRNHAPADLPPHWVVAPREAMLIFLADLREAYGSVERYAATAGVDSAEVAALRALLLEDARQADAR